VTRGSIRSTVLMCLALISIVVALFVLKMLRTSSLDETALRELGVVLLPTPRELIMEGLTTDSGEGFTTQNLTGAWTLLFFGFTNCPDVCPTTMAELGKAKRELVQNVPEVARQMRVVLVTVDPEQDDAETLGRYVRAFSPDFVGVNGSRESIAKFATQVNVAFGKVPDGEGGYTVDHSGNIVIVNPYGHYAGFIKLPHKASTIRDAVTSMVERY
jgi:protein SCO1